MSENAALPMLETIGALPMMARLLGSLGLILAVNRLAGNLTLSVLAGAICLAAVSGQTAASALEIAGARLVSPDSLYLMCVVFLVVWLSNQMARAGVMKDLVAAVRAKLGKRHSMAVLPAVIGFLPMPGGALFSAPLVDECDADGTTAPLVKARANFWFRHIWEFWWPLYPGVLLALHLTGLEIWQLVLPGLPLSLVAAAGGYFFLLRKIDPGAARPAPVTAPQSLAGLLTPIGTVVGGYAIFRLSAEFLPDGERLNRYLPMIFGVLLAMLTLEKWRPLKPRDWREIVWSGKTAGLVLIVAAVRVYGAFVESAPPDGVSPIEIMKTEMAQFGVPAVALAMLLPFVAGVTTGLAVGFVGASFPVVIGLLGSAPPTDERLAFAVLAYACGHMGQMLSPVHVCLIVTNEHFKIGLSASLRGLLAPALLVILAGLAGYAGIRYF